MNRKTKVKRHKKNRYWLIWDDRDYALVRSLGLPIQGERQSVEYDQKNDTVIHEQEITLSAELLKKLDQYSGTFIWGPLV